ncbi:hypothetical protein Q9Q95_08220 [Sphingomonas sp. DG1-23]|uniref:hypothetical protein n=1 Tax=Sphingomonas sp. DG1-23 TaxID=3068316 RepID=UPI0027400DB2|nr:hypothetical protein [Sphingomonas sp. DG1-23]MDP5278905.1 hypothetical protein [Sphingomonas sp. DG1-23]
MAANANPDRQAPAIPWRAIGWGGAASLLALPLIARAPWTGFDFMAMAGLLGSVGLGLELVVRKSAGMAYRTAAGIALLASFLLVWSNGAVGMIGSEHDPRNLLFAGVLAIGFGGAMLARFRARGMAWAMLATAVAQVLAGLSGLTSDVRGSGLATGFAALWLLSAALFREAGLRRAE